MQMLQEKQEETPNAQVSGLFSRSSCMKGYRVSIKQNDLLDLTSEKSYAGKTSNEEKVTDAKSTITIDRGFTCTTEDDEEEFQLLLDTHTWEKEANGKHTCLAFSARDVTEVSHFEFLRAAVDAQRMETYNWTVADRCSR